MKTVLVASSKGGVGKTTIATHLAAQSALDGLRTALVDADPQAPRPAGRNAAPAWTAPCCRSTAPAARPGARDCPTTPSAW